MENNQRGGILAFILVAIVLFAAMVGGVYVAKNYGETLAGGAQEVADQATDDTAETTDDATQDEAAKEEQPARDEELTTDDDETAQSAPGEDTEESADQSPDRIASNDQVDDYDEVVEAPDDETHSQAPDGISGTGPSEVASAGPADGLMAVIPLAALTTSAVAYGRSRAAL